MMQSAGPAAPPRVVLDTNVFLSAVLFSGPTSRLVSLWQARRFTPLLSRPILEEYLRVLSYPKFELSEREVKSVIQEELLPFFETISKVSLRGIPFLKDPSDRKFLACARSGKADYLVTGDQVLLAQKRVASSLIITPGEFLKKVTYS